jgi:hypothetical protein
MQPAAIDPMRTAPSPPPRPPLGLPPGSIRAVLVFMIAGMFWLYLLLPEPQGQEGKFHVPMYLFGLLSMVLLFYVAHGHSIAPSGSVHSSPLWLPRGFFRLLLAAGFILAVVGANMLHPELLRQRLIPSSEQMEQWPNILLAMAIGFGLGRLMRFGPWKNSPVFLDLQAWVALLAVLGLLANVMIRLFINPKLLDPLEPLLMEAILTGIVAFYFGARS